MPHPNVITGRAMTWLAHHLNKFFKGGMSFSKVGRNYVVQFVGDDVRAACDRDEMTTDELFEPFAGPTCPVCRKKAA